MFDGILSTPTARLGRASRFVVFQIKLWSNCASLLKKNRAGQHAAALSYYTIFGIVPLTIVALLIFQSFPAYSDIGDKVKNIVYKQLHLTTIQLPSQTEPEKTIMFTEHLDNIINRVFAGINEGSIALISTILIIWAALDLLSTIERSFNNIWHISKGRNFLNRIINYWAILTLGPLLLGAGIFVATKSSTFSQIQKTVLLLHIGPPVLSYVISVVAFFLLYFLLPNTKVSAKAAIWGAAVAALVWSIAKWGFGLYVTEFIPYGKMYGVVGLIPLTVFWIYITWLIVLFGLQLTFTTQHLNHLDAAAIAAARRSEEYFIANDLTFINIVREIAAAFEANQAPVPSEVICSKLNIPAEFGSKILNHLVANRILIKSSEPIVGFVPAQAPENIKLSDISEVVSKAGFAQPAAGDATGLEQITQSQRNALSQFNLKQILRLKGGNET